SAPRRSSRSTASRRVSRGSRSAAGFGRDELRLPRREGRPEAGLDLADVVGQVLLGCARGERVLQAGERRDEPAALHERAGERRQDLLREPTERERASERTDGLAGSIVQEERLAEAAEQLGGRHALLGVL